MPHRIMQGKARRFVTSGRFRVSNSMLRCDPAMPTVYPETSGFGRRSSVSGVTGGGTAGSTWRTYSFVSSTAFPICRTYGSGSGIDFVAPPVDDRVTIEVIDELDDALLQLVSS